MKPKNPQGGPDRPEQGGGMGERGREQGGRESGRERKPAEGGDVETGGQEKEREAGRTGDEEAEE